MTGLEIVLLIACLILASVAGAAIWLIIRIGKAFMRR